MPPNNLLPDIILDCYKAVTPTIFEGSSVYENNEADFGADKVLDYHDGQPGGYWHSDWHENPWLTLGIPNAASIVAVDVHDRGDTSKFWFRFANVSVKAGYNSTSRDCGIKSHVPAAYSQHDPNPNSYRFQCGKGTIGTKVLIQKLGLGYFHVDHVKIWSKTECKDRELTELPALPEPLCKIGMSFHSVQCYTGLPNN